MSRKASIPEQLNLEELREMNESLRAQLADYRRRGLDDSGGLTLSILSDQIISLKRALADADEAAEAKYRALIREAEAKFQEAVKKNEAQIVASKLEIASAENEVRAQYQLIVKEREATIAELQSEITRVEIQTKNRFQEIICEKDEQVAASKAMAANLRETLNEAETQHERLEARILESSAKVRELERTIEQLRGSGNELRDDYNRKLAKISDSGWEKDMQIRELRALESDLRQEIERHKEAAIEQERVRQATENRVYGLKVELATSQGEVAKLKQQCEYELRMRETLDKRSGAAEMVANLKSQFSNELARLKNERKSLVDQLTVAQAEIDELKREILQGQTALSQARLQTERAVHAARMEVEHTLNAKVVRVRELETILDGAERELKRALASEQKIKQEAERLEERARTIESDLHAEMTKMQSESAALAVQLSAAREQVTEQRALRTAAERDFAKANEVIAGLREVILQRQAEIQEAREKGSEQTREMEFRMRREIAEAEAKTNTARQDLARAKRVIGERDRQLDIITSERDANLLESSRMKTELERIADHASQLTVRENQLRAYAGSLTKDKSELQKAGKLLAEEIRVLSATHPLKDYLAATEHELSKMELQLKTTPTLAADRAKLEDCVAQLIEQRDFLKSVLAGSQKQFERQAAGVEQLLARGAFAPVPPPPPVPNVRKSASRQITVLPVPVAQAESMRDGPNLRWEKPFDNIA